MQQSEIDLGIWRPIQNRLWNKVKKTRSCWNWTGHISERGYGRILNPPTGRLIKVHRLAWALLRGKPPNGTETRHLCGNKICVNPRHMRQGTHQENMQDRDDQGRTARGERVHTAKLTADDVRLMRRLYATGVYTKKLLAQIFGVSDVMGGATIRGEYWQHVDA